MWKYAVVLLLAVAAHAEPVSYRLDPEHSYPSFEADHMGGLSIWRGKLTRSEGTVVLDREARSGSIEVTMQVASIDFGHAKMNARALAADIFDAANWPIATYSARFSAFEGDIPVEASGELTLHGTTLPLVLKIDRFKCMMHPLAGVEVCGADASASFDRSAFGISFGEQYGFDMEVRLQIQVEALRVD